MKAFDAMIVGAGPAGCTAAILLARAGWSVALVERQVFPRRKVCGECIAASNLPLLHALGIGAAFDAAAGPALQRVTLLAGDAAVTAGLPAAPHPRHRWGRALGRETLDTLLRDQARAAGAVVLQPWSVQAVQGAPGRWRCDLRSAASGEQATLRAALLIDAHGSWEAPPAGLPPQRAEAAGGDLLAFKASFTGAQLPAGAIAVLALDGGYGGMVLGDGGITTVAACLRRDRLAALRSAWPGARAGDVVEAFLRRECTGVRTALAGAVRQGPWLAAGPLATGVRVGVRVGVGVHRADGAFRIGNAAGEAHPILGEGMSIALQSAALLCARLLAGGAGAPDAATQASLQRAHAAAWRRSFLPRLYVAAAFAHLAMRPGGTALLMALLRRWPGLLTQGARWGGKVQCSALPLGATASTEPRTR